MDYLIIEAVRVKVDREDRDAHDKAQAAADMKVKKEEAIEELKRLYPSRGR